MAHAEQIVEEFVFTTRDGLPIYYDSPKGLALSRSLALVAQTLHRNFSERVRFCRAADRLFLFEQFPGMLGMVVASEKKSVPFLRKQLAAVRDVLELVLGRGLPDPSRSLVGKKALYRAVNAMVFMHSHVQSFMLNSLEAVQVDPSVRVAAGVPLAEAASRVPGAVHALLFTDLKLAANASLDPDTSIRASELASVLAYFQGQFYPRGDRFSDAEARRRTRSSTGSRRGSMRSKKTTGSVKKSSSWHESTRARPTVAAWLDSANDDVPVPKGVQVYDSASGDMFTDALTNKPPPNRAVSFVLNKPVRLHAKHAGKVQTHRLSSAFLRVETGVAAADGVSIRAEEEDAEDPLLASDPNAAHLKSGTAPLFMRLGLRGGNESPVWVYYAELGSGSTLMIVARRTDQEDETDAARGVRKFHRESKDAIVGAPIAEFNAARQEIAQRLAPTLGVLMNAEQTHFTVLQYQKQFPDLLHFMLCNRTANQLLAPTVIPLQRAGQSQPVARSVFDFIRVSRTSAPDDVFTKAYSLDVMLQNVRTAASLSGSALQLGYNAMYRRMPQVQVLYRLWFEDAKGRVVPIEHQSKSMPMLAIDANYFAPFAANLFPGRDDLTCYELYVVFNQTPTMSACIAQATKLLDTLIRR